MYESGWYVDFVMLSFYRFVSTHHKWLVSYIRTYFVFVYFFISYFSLYRSYHIKLLSIYVLIKGEIIDHIRLYSIHTTKWNCS